ncbi:MAG: TonB-dependent receptor, partial [Exilibacterium sp.]
WNLDLSVLYTNSSAVAESDSGSFATQAKLGTDIWVLDSIFEGALFESSGGMAKLAVGSQYRLEKFTAMSSTSFDGRENIDRDISAVFAELFVPLVGKGNEQWSARELELTIAARYEEYSDLGYSANPKLGLLWSPVEGVKFRSTYSRSFRAPLLFDLSETTNPTGSTIYLVPDPFAGSASTPALLLAGNNPDLKAERATNWTLGADFTPSLWPDLQVSLTYFDIDYTDQIQKVISPAEAGNALSERAYESIVTRSPDLELINFWASQPNFRNPMGLSLEDIDVLVDNRLHNILSVRERGLDFEINHWTNSVFGEFIFQIGGTYLLDLNSQLTDTAESVELLNTPYNPVDLKLRNSVVWNLNDFTANLAIYYVDSYKDKRNLEYERTISSWTTVDLNVRYNMDWSSASWLNNTTFSLSVSNLFDRQPPFVANSQGYNFDATNASAMGRRISIDIRKQW